MLSHRGVANGTTNQPAASTANDLAAALDYVSRPIGE
jgi:hypothetical protein